MGLNAGTICFCADNLFDVSQYPLHTQPTGDEEATGYEGYHVADGRRDAADAWRALTANADHTLSVTFDKPRGFDFAAIDRESNHVDFTATPPAGKRFILSASDDAFATTRTEWDVTIPVVPGGTLDGGLGALTDENAWLKTFSLDVASGARLTSKAMGTGLVPQITGFWLGKSWRPAQAEVFYPDTSEQFQIGVQEVETLFGWKGHNRPYVRRQGAIVIKQFTDADNDMIQWQVLGLFARGWPAWLVFDRIDGARRAMLVRCPAGLLGWLQNQFVPLHELTIPFEEVQPA